MPAGNSTIFICTVGGSPEPIIYAMRMHKPAHVLFFCSKASAQSVTEQILPALKISPAWRILTLDDEQDLLSCVVDMRSGIAQALNSWGFPQGTALLCDFTGGTKVMSASVVMALMESNVQFTYTGGSKRDKGGLGIVQSGAEKHLYLANPWQVLAFPLMQQMSDAFNSFRFPEASRLALRIAEHGVRRNFFTALADICRAYALWDGFRHKEAAHAFSPAIHAMKTTAPPLMGSFLQTVHANYLDLCTATTELDAFIEQGSPCPNYLLDLAANALRRETQGYFDDAVSRLYSLLEKAAKITLACEYGLNTSNIPPNTLPQKFMEDSPPILNHSGNMQLPLFRSFQLLAYLEHPLGLRFMAQKEELEELLQARNFSMLAHGFEPVSEETCVRLRILVLNFLNISQEVLTAFPILNTALLT